MSLVLQETCCSSLVLKPWRLDQETSEEKLFIKTGQIARQLPTDSYLSRITKSEFSDLIFGLCLCIFFFSSFMETLFLLCDSKPCTYDVIYIWWGCYILYAILYFCFTLRCYDEFCLKCFRNKGCQSLLTINSLLAKFFKSLC